MYQQFFGLRKDPFAMTPDPAFLYLTAAHREALAGLTYAILSRKGFVVLTGDAGTGKTTLLTRVLQSIPATRARFSVVLNPMLTPSEFLEMALTNFGLGAVALSNKAQRLMALQQFLVASHGERKVPVLVVDEAHKLSPEVLEEIRLLSNFELADGKLLQIVLAGQSELGNLLNREDLRQFKQRVAVRLGIQPLAPGEVAQYIQHRWAKAGAAQPHPFDAEAVSRIAQGSHGIPRSINVLCDNALMLAYGEGVSTISARHVQEAARDLDLLEAQSRVTRAIEASPGAAAAVADALLNGAGVSPLPAAVPTLERYSPAGGASRPSRLRRLADMLGLVTGGANS